jgi:YggT family protein
VKDRRGFVAMKSGALEATPPAVQLWPMLESLTALAALTQILRSVFLVGGIVLAVVATADWAARARRLNPFGGLARFMRARVDPRLVGIERQVIRAGGRGTATPWWALVAYVMLAALALGALEMLGTIFRELAVASSVGASGFLLLAVRWTFGFLRLALLVRVLSSWFPSLAVSRWTRWAYGATEWMLRPLRRLIPSLGVIDITPIVAYFALQILQYLVETILLNAMR